MAKTENQAVKSGREKLLERASKKFPDRHFTAPDGQNVPDGQKLDDLDDAISEILDEQEGGIRENAEKNQALYNLMMSDPQCAEFVGDWIETGDPRAALVRTFGDELAELATEEGRGKFADDLKDWRKRKAENDELSRKSEENWSAFLEKLNAWGDGKGLDNQKKAEIGARLVDVYEKGLTNAYDESDFEMAYKALSFDKAVDGARQEGRVAGRNDKIEAQRRQRSAAAGMPPSMAGGQGMRVPAPKPAAKKSVWDDIE